MKTPIVSTRPKLLVKNGVNARSHREDQHSANEHSRRAEAVGERAGDGLRQAPHKLPHRHREADGHNTDAGGTGHRKNEQPLRLPRAHRDHQERRRNEGEIEPGKPFVHNGHSIFCDVKRNSAGC